MHSTVCCAILALPIIGWNAINILTIDNSLQPSKNKVSRITDLVSGTKILRSHFIPFEISARDDRIKDCLRSGNCKN